MFDAECVIALTVLDTTRGDLQLAGHIFLYLGPRCRHPKKRGGESCCRRLGVLTKWRELEWIGKEEMWQTKVQVVWHSPRWKDVRKSQFENRKGKGEETFIMETLTVDKEFGSAMGALFHQIITDMKVKKKNVLFFFMCGRYYTIVTGRKRKKKMVGPPSCWYIQQRWLCVCAGVVVVNFRWSRCFEGSCGKLEPPRALNCPRSLFRNKKKTHFLKNMYYLLWVRWLVS